MKRKVSRTRKQLQVVEEQSEMKYQRKEVDHLLPIQTQMKYNCSTMPSSYVFVYKFLPPPPFSSRVDILSFVDTLLLNVWYIYRYWTMLQNTSQKQISLKWQGPSANKTRHSLMTKFLLFLGSGDRNGYISQIALSYVWSPRLQNFTSISKCPSLNDTQCLNMSCFLLQHILKMHTKVDRLFQAFAKVPVSLTF